MSRLRIGERILSFRKERGLTQSELGELLGVTAFAVSKWERGISYPDIFLLPDISRLMDISIDELFGNDDRGIKPVKQ